MKELTIEHKPQKERCILVGISTPMVRPWLATEQLAELGRLAETAGAWSYSMTIFLVHRFAI